MSEIQTNNLTENLVFLTDIIKRKIIDLNWKKKKSVILLKRHYQSIFEGIYYTDDVSIR